jgi:hypothetical protein
MVVQRRARSFDAKWFRESILQFIAGVPAMELLPKISPLSDLSKL